MCGKYWPWTRETSFLRKPVRDGSPGGEAPNAARIMRGPRRVIELQRGLSNGGRIPENIIHQKDRNPAIDHVEIRARRIGGREQVRHSCALYRRCSPYRPESAALPADQPLPVFLEVDLPIHDICEA